MPVIRSIGNKCLLRVLEVERTEEASIEPHVVPVNRSTSVNSLDVDVSSEGLTFTKLIVSLVVQDVILILTVDIVQNSNLTIISCSVIIVIQSNEINRNRINSIILSLNLNLCMISIQNQGVLCTSVTLNSPRVIDTMVFTSIE